MYRCSECNRPIGVMLERDGSPRLFKCHVTGRIAHTIPRLAIRRKPVKSMFAGGKE